MVNQYALKFTGKISWEGQANGLPPEIYAFIILEGFGGAQEKAFIDQTIEQQAAAFHRTQTMVVQRDQGRMLDMRVTPADRIIVPFKWIVSISASIHKLGAELTEPDGEGVERLKDHTTPLLN
jgi:hypothetical protein